jgi:hypothetical protein
MAEDDFYNKALASLINQINSSQQNLDDNHPNSYAKSLIEDDLPKIDSAIKSYLSLVAARSSTVSEIDVLSFNTASESINTASERCGKNEDIKCVFLENGNKASLNCARVLLRGINSTIILNDELDSALHASKNADNALEEKHNSIEGEKLQKNVIRILWNGLVTSQEKGKASNNKPSKLLGREALRVAYPFVRERFRRGIAAAAAELLDGTKSNNFESIGDHRNEYLQSIPNEQLAPIAPPNDVDIVQWEAYYTEFGNLLSRACCCDTNNDKEVDEKDGGGGDDDDSRLLWSMDGGVQELKERRERRNKRAEGALGDVEKSGAVDESTTETP